MTRVGMFGWVLCALMLALPQAALAQGAPKTGQRVDINKAKPSGTVTLDETEIRLIFGGNDGKGVLNFQGKQYRFTAKGVTVGGIGVQSVHATGNVYFLKKVEDFPGDFSEASAGITVVKGFEKSTYQNNKGVYMTLSEKNSGAALALGVGVLRVQLVK